MKVIDLMKALVNLNVNAEIKFKSNNKSDKVEVRVDSDNVYKQKEVTIVVGTRK